MRDITWCGPTLALLTALLSLTAVHAQYMQLYGAGPDLYSRNLQRSISTMSGAELANLLQRLLRDAALLRKRSQDNGDVQDTVPRDLSVLEAGVKTCTWSSRRASWVRAGSVLCRCRFSSTAPVMLALTPPELSWTDRSPRNKYPTHSECRLHLKRVRRPDRVSNARKKTVRIKIKLKLWQKHQSDATIVRFLPLAAACAAVSPELTPAYQTYYSSLPDKTR
ncbi:uncharacterized protein LOC144095400 [Amblyomma americanum]